MTAFSRRPRLSGREAAYLFRLLALARARGFPLLPAAEGARGLAGFPQLRRLEPELSAAGEDGLIPAIEAALARGPDAAAAGMLAALRPAGLPADGLRALSRYLSTRGAERARFLRAVSYPLVLAATACFVVALVLQATVGIAVVGALDEVFPSGGAPRDASPGATSSAASLAAAVALALPRLGLWLMKAPLGPLLYALVVASLAALGLWLAAGLESGSSRLARLVYGRLLRLRTAEAFSSALALLLPRMPLPEALALAAATSPNRDHRRLLSGLADVAASGESAGEAFRACTALPPAVRWRLWAAYFRSDLPAELARVADACRAELVAAEGRTLARATALSWLLAGVALFPVWATALGVYDSFFRFVSQLG